MYIDDDCSICLDYITKSIKGECILKCSHRIHSLCLQDLLDSDLKQLCPICRKPIEINDFIPPNVEIKSDFITKSEPIIKPICSSRYISQNVTNIHRRSNSVSPLSLEIPRVSLINKFKLFLKHIIM